MSEFFPASEKTGQESASHRQPSGADPAETGPDTAPERDSASLREGRVQGVLHSDSASALRSTSKAHPEIEPHLVSLLAPTAFEAEQYRLLRHIMERLHKDSGLSVIAISSPAVGDGKTTTAINLAGALAQAPKTRVLLIDADLRKPSVSRHLGLSTAGDQGLVDAILDANLSLDAVVTPCLPFNLSVLPAGRPLINPYELLKSPRLGELVEEMRQRYDYIVLDTPPLLPLPDCQLLEAWIDGLLVVMSPYKTPRKLAEEALSVVNPAKLIGLVSNNDNRPALRYYYSSYYAHDSSSNRGWRKRLSRAGDERRRFVWLGGLVLVIGLLALLPYRDFLSEKWQALVSLIQPSSTKVDPQEKGRESLRQSVVEGVAQAAVNPVAEDKQALAGEDPATQATQQTPLPEKIEKRSKQQSRASRSRELSKRAIR